MSMPATREPRPRLFLNHLADLDWLIALEFGRVDDGQPSEHWHGVHDKLGFLCDGPDGPAVGFKLVDCSVFDPDAVEALWDGPRFDVPALGLDDVPAAPVITAARTLFGGRDSANRVLFRRALSLDGDPREIEAWRLCLQAGDGMAHFGLGCALYGAGEVHEAHRHLRHYAEIAPAMAWNWCWAGKAALACGLVSEARAAFELALELDEDDETDAQELLDQLAS